MTTLRFADLNRATAFTRALNARAWTSRADLQGGLSAVVLTKLPLTADAAMIDFVVHAMREGLEKNKCE
jgi:hypothetical protein